MVFHAEYVGEGHVLTACGVALDALRDVEIQQEVLADGFGDLVAGLGNHAVSDDAAVLRDGHVGSARADIH